jgi:hypothetical protein
MPRRVDVCRLWRSKLHRVLCHQVARQPQPKRVRRRSQGVKRGNWGGKHVRHGVVECLVLTFSDWSLAGAATWKSLTITGTSLPRPVPCSARRNTRECPWWSSLPTLSNMCRVGTLAACRRAAIGVNQQRLLSLCQHLDQNPGRFTPSALADAASESVCQQGPDNMLLEGVLWQRRAAHGDPSHVRKFGMLALTGASGAAK